MHCELRAGELTHGKIARLPPDLADQIAAGEVVERPASVIKELVENAVDAGARRVVITVEQGGKRLIRVEDDGEGMDADDATLAVERHATSKLRTSDDLGRIATLGFRGEALPAVASVSHFTLRTRERDATAGVEVTVDGGAPALVRETGAPAGTSVEVRDLFYNLPARRKFLKSDAAEMAQVTRVVTQMALCYVRWASRWSPPGAGGSSTPRRHTSAIACSRSTATGPTWCPWSAGPPAWRSPEWWPRWRPLCRGVRSTCS